jgi:hypothetical protein
MTILIQRQHRQYPTYWHLPLALRRIRRQLVCDRVPYALGQPIAIIISSQLNLDSLSTMSR